MGVAMGSRQPIRLRVGNSVFAVVDAACNPNADIGSRVDHCREFCRRLSPPVCYTATLGKLQGVATLGGVRRSTRFSRAAVAHAIPTSRWVTSILVNLPERQAQALVMSPAAIQFSAG
jgi:hypothetical protein